MYGTSTNFVLMIIDSSVSRYLDLSLVILLLLEANKKAKSIKISMIKLYQFIMLCLNHHLLKKFGSQPTRDLVLIFSIVQM